MSSIKGAYYITKLLFSLAWALIHLRWSIWRAKKSFAGELREQGLPEDVVWELASSYNDQSKRLLSDLLKLKDIQQ